MRKYLNEYILEIENKLKEKISSKDVENHLVKISFFSHERLIHLIVTMFFALFSIIFIFVSINQKSILLLVIGLILLVVLFFYIFHYFFLENKVQYLYKLYDEMLEKLK